MQKGKNLKKCKYAIIGALIISLVIPIAPLSTLSVSARCMPVVQLQPRTITTSPGESFSLSVYVDSCAISLKAIWFKMTYPHPDIILNNLTYENLLGRRVWQHDGDDNGTGCIEYTFGRKYGNPLSPVKGNFVTISFNVSSTASLGVYQICLENHIFDQRDSYFNDTPLHCTNINVVAPGNGSNDGPDDSSNATSSDLMNNSMINVSGGQPGIDIEPRIFSADQSICLHVILDSRGAPVRSVGIRLWYPLSFQFLNGVYADLLGHVTQVFVVDGGNSEGFFSYTVSRLLDIGNSPAPINGTVFVIYFDPVPRGIYELCFECEMYDPSLELISTGGYQCVDVTVEGNVTGGNNAAGEGDNLTGEDNMTNNDNRYCNCIYGDSNRDCRIDIFDLDALMQAWGSCRDCKDPRYRECMDCDGDGVIGIIDLDYLTQHWEIVYCDCKKCNASWSACTHSPVEPATCNCRKGDYDCDGDVDIDDLTIFKDALGSCYPDIDYKECCDFDDDGDIDLEDDYRMNKVIGTIYCDCNECTPPWESWS